MRDCSGALLSLALLSPPAKQPASLGPHAVAAATHHLSLLPALRESDGVLTLGLEGRIGDNPNRWLGFGVSEPNATDVLMPGSDVVVGE